MDDNAVLLPLAPSRRKSERQRRIAGKPNQRPSVIALLELAVSWAWMKIGMRILIAVVAMLVPAILLLQAGINERTTMTVCETAGLLDQLDGRFVKIRGEVVQEMGMLLLRDQDCSARRLLVEQFDTDPLSGLTGQFASRREPLLLDVAPSFGFLLAWERQWRWHWIQPARPVHIKEDESYRTLIAHLAQSGMENLSICSDCRASAITATLTGRLDHFASHTVDIRHTLDAPIISQVVGFGDRKVALSRLVLQSVSDVETRPTLTGKQDKRR